MRTLLCFLAPGAALLLLATPSQGQVTESQRAAARDLFKEGDALQRSGKLVEALDKFQRAQAVFDAPTNQVRIAECEAALGRLVESSEAYRSVLRVQLPAGSPPAFQAAVDQARAELAQVEPRVPRLVIDVQPTKAPGMQLQIDGQNVPAALVGASMPLDPGSHRVIVSAPGYASAEQQVVLKEQEAKTLSLTLKAAANATAATPAGPAAPPPPPPASPAPGGPSAGGTHAVPPPPPEVELVTTPPAPQGSRTALLLGGHLGWEIVSGQVPIDANTKIDARELGGSGAAFALDAGLRFARQWYAGLTLEHAELGGGNHASLDASVTNASSSTTQFGAVLGLITNPARTSFYGHLGLAYRWYNVSLTGTGVTSPPTYTSGEASLGAGLWLPAGRAFRIVPEVTLGVGTFDAPSSTTTGSGGASAGHIFVMLGVAGFLNVDL